MGGMLLFALLFVLVFLFFCKLFCGGLIPIVIVFNIWNLANAFHCGEKLVIFDGVHGGCERWSFGRIII